MTRRVLTAVGLAVVLVAGVAMGAEPEKFEYRQDQDIKQVRGKKPATVTLKRDDTGRYSWEIKGEDTEEVVASDKRLREYLRMK